jgi:predicted permease
VDARVLGFSIVVSLFTALLFGLAPAWRAARTEPSAALRGAGAVDGVQGARVRSVLVAGQVALCLVLVVGAALFLRSVARGLDTETGIDATGVAAVSFGLAQHGYDASRGRAFLRTLLDRAGSSAGVEAVAVATHVPLGPQRTGMPVTADLAESSSGSMGGSMTAVNAVAGDYFRVFGLRVIAGRVFDAGDGEGSTGVVVLNEAAAARLWPGSDPIGMRLQLVRGIGEPMTVIGVVGNAKAHGLEDDDLPYVYVSALQNPNLGVLDAVSLLVRGRSDATAALAAGRSAIGALDESLPLFDERRVQDQLDTVLMPQRFGLTLLGLFGTLALAVSSIGIYGVVACSVRQRRREMSIRAALGARPVTVALALAGETFGALVIGAAVGLLGVLLLAGFLAPFLFGVGARDAVSIVGALLVLAAITTCAALLPVARTAREGGAAALRAATGS